MRAVPPWPQIFGIADFSGYRDFRKEPASAGRLRRKSFLCVHVEGVCNALKQHNALTAQALAPIPVRSNRASEIRERFEVQRIVGLA